MGFAGSKEKISDLSESSVRRRHIPSLHMAVASMSKLIFYLNILLGVFSWLCMCLYDPSKKKTFSKKNNQTKQDDGNITAFAHRGCQSQHKMKIANPPMVGVNHAKNMKHLSWTPTWTTGFSLYVKYFVLERNNIYLPQHLTLLLSTELHFQISEFSFALLRQHVFVSGQSDSVHLHRQ